MGSALEGGAFFMTPSCLWACLAITAGMALIAGGQPVLLCRNSSLGLCTHVKDVKRDIIDRKGNPESPPASEPGNVPEGCFKT